MAAAHAEELSGPEPRTRSGRIGRLFSKGPLHIFLIVISLAWLTPTVGLLITSFRDAADNGESGWWNAITTPRQLTLEPYQNILTDESLIGAFWNTVRIAVPSSILVVILGALAAYAFSWIDFKGRDPLFLIIIGLLVVPLQMALIPAARLFNSLNIFGTVSAAIIFHIAFGLPFAIFLLRNFFIGIPRDLIEAARIDGASEMQIFRRIMLPLGMPAIASLLIFQFLWTWNDLLVALTFAPGNAAPLTVFIQSQTRQFGANLDIIAPGAFLTMVVPLLVFFAFQRFFVEGVLAGSVK
jgi:alpha-glucoside transport system permease protein